MRPQRPPPSSTRPLTRPYLLQESHTSKQCHSLWGTFSFKPPQRLTIIFFSLPKVLTCSLIPKEGIGCLGFVSPTLLPLVAVFRAKATAGKQTNKQSRKSKRKPLEPRLLCSPACPTITTAVITPFANGLCFKPCTAHV